MDWAIGIDGNIAECNVCSQMPSPTKARKQFSTYLLMFLDSRIIKVVLIRLHDFEHVD